MGIDAIAPDAYSYYSDWKHNGLDHTSPSADSNIGEMTSLLNAAESLFKSSKSLSLQLSAHVYYQFELGRIQCACQ